LLADKQKITMSNANEITRSSNDDNDVDDLYVGGGLGYLSLGEQIAITFAPAISGVLSLIGSGTIISMIVHDWENKRTSVKYRFLFCLSVADIVNSMWFIVW
jgi:hypothetical protein